MLAWSCLLSPNPKNGWNYQTWWRSKTNKDLEERSCSWNISIKRVRPSHGHSGMTAQFEANVVERKNICPLKQRHSLHPSRLLSVSSHINKTNMPIGANLSSVRHATCRVSHSYARPPAEARGAAVVAGWGGWCLIIIDINRLCSGFNLPRVMNGSPVLQYKLPNRVLLATRGQLHEEDLMRGDIQTTWVSICLLSLLSRHI